MTVYLNPIIYDSTLGVYDLALSRQTHDMVFPVVNQPVKETDWDVDVTTPPDATEWDSTTDPTEWDDRATMPPQLCSIWFINGADKVAQQIKITLLAFLGEWFLDITFGVPYLEEILIKNPRMSTVESILRSHILDVPHVLFIQAFAMDWDRKARTLSVEFICDTDYGAIKDSFKLETTSV